MLSILLILLQISSFACFLSLCKRIISCEQCLCLGWIHNCIATKRRALRTDLQLLRRKGAIKVGGSLDRPIIDSKSACARCCLVFGYINRGAECNLCHLRVCRECRIDVSYSKNDWVCIICYKEMWVTNGRNDVPTILCCEWHNRKHLIFWVLCVVIDVSMLIFFVFLWTCSVYLHRLFNRACLQWCFGKISSRMEIVFWFL